MQQHAPLRVTIAGLSCGHVVWLLRNWQRNDLDIVGFWEPDRVLAHRYAEQYAFPEELSVSPHTSSLGAWMMLIEAAPRSAHAGHAQPPPRCALQSPRPLQGMGSAGAHTSKFSLHR
jgi:hypothetical protein